MFEVLLSFLSALLSFQASLSFNVLSCSFDSSHSFEILSLSLSFKPCLVSFEVLLSFLSALFSFQASLSFKSYLVRSTPLIRLKASLFRGTPADFRWKSFFRFSMLFLFFSGLSFVPVLSCSFESSHSFEILSLSLFKPCLVSFDSSYSFAASLFRWTPADFRSK